MLRILLQVIRTPGILLFSSLYGDTHQGSATGPHEEGDWPVKGNVLSVEQMVADEAGRAGGPAAS